MVMEIRLPVIGSHGMRHENILIDESDESVMHSRLWRVRFGAKSGPYVVAALKDNGHRSTTVYLHRVLMGNPPGEEVDHVDGNGLNNCRSNLRIATRRQNQCNVGLTKANTSGFKGVSWDASKRKYAAQIMVNYRNIHLGKFETSTDAARAYNRAALRMHGPFAKLNVLDGEDQP